MRRLLIPACLLASASLAAAAPSRHPVAPVAAALSPYAACDLAVAASAQAAAPMPATLLPAIARAESGRLDPATGRVRPWPWTINVDGVGFFFDSKPAVIAAVQALQAQGKQSIDVGCMQINLMHHPNAFLDLDDAFDPAANAAYAVRFLSALFAQTKDWPLAAAYYHSSTPDLGEQYQRLVFGRVLTPMGAGSAAAAAGITIDPPLGAWPSLSERFAAIPPASVTFRVGTPKPATPAAGGLPVLAIGAYPNLLQPGALGAKR